MSRLTNLTTSLAGLLLYGCVSAGSIIGLTGCTYGSSEEDWERYGRVRLSTEWQTKNYPGQMNYYFYGEGTDIPIVREGNAEGYEGVLPAGTYQVVVCNTDGEDLDLEMIDGYEEAFGCACLISGLKPFATKADTLSTLYIKEPRHFYGGSIRSLTVGGPKYVVDEVYPVALTREVELNIRVEGLSVRPAMTGLLTGVSPKVHIPSGKPSFEIPANLPFTPAQVADNVFSASLSLFDLAHGEREDDCSCLYLELTTSGGIGMRAFADITEITKQAFSQSTSMHIILDVIVSPGEAGGLQITIPGWKEGSAEAG